MKRFTLRRAAPRPLTDEEPCHRCGTATLGRDAFIDADGELNYRPLCAKCRAKRYRTGAKR